MCLRCLGVCLPLSQIWKGGRGLIHCGNSACHLVWSGQGGGAVFNLWKQKLVSVSNVWCLEMETCFLETGFRFREWKQDFFCFQCLGCNQTPQKPVFSFTSTIYTLSNSLHWLFYFSSFPFHPGIITCHLKNVNLMMPVIFPAIM